MALHSIPNTTPNGVAVKLSTNIGTNPKKAAWVQVVASGTTVRIGGPDVDSTHGIPMANGAGQFMAPLGNADAYDLDNIYAYATGSDYVAGAYFTN